MNWLEKIYRINKINIYNYFIEDMAEYILSVVLVLVSFVYTRECKGCRECTEFSIA